MSNLDELKAKSDKAYRNYCLNRRRAEQAMEGGNLEAAFRFSQSAEKYGKDVKYFEGLVAAELAA